MLKKLVLSLLAATALVSTVQAQPLNPSATQAWVNSNFVKKSGDTMTGPLSMASGVSINWNSDTILVRDSAANILALRNGTSAQTFNIYNTYTDASNYEKLQASWSANLMTFGTAAAGTGTIRGMRLASGSTNIDIEVAGALGSIDIHRNGTSSSTIFAVTDISGLTSTGVLFTRLLPKINQASGTYVALDINPTETLVGAGPHNLVQGRIAAGANVFSIRNTGQFVSAYTAAMMTSSAAWANGAAGNTGTLLNAPAAGNPTKWVPINDNGTVRYVPAW